MSEAEENDILEQDSEAEEGDVEMSLMSEVGELMSFHLYHVWYLALFERHSLLFSFCSLMMQVRDTKNLQSNCDNNTKWNNVKRRQETMLAHTYLH